MTKGNECSPRRDRLSSGAGQQEAAVVQHPVVADRHRQAALDVPEMTEAVRHPSADRWTCPEESHRWRVGETERKMMAEACVRPLDGAADQWSLVLAAGY